MIFDEKEELVYKEIMRELYRRQNERIDGAYGNIRFGFHSLITSQNMSDETKKLESVVIQVLRKMVHEGLLKAYDSPVRYETTLKIIEEYKKMRREEFII